MKRGHYRNRINCSFEKKSKCGCFFSIQGGSDLGSQLKVKNSFSGGRSH